MARTLITEQMIIDASRNHEFVMTIPRNALITQAAQERAVQLNIRLVEKADEKKVPAQSKGSPENHHVGGEVVIGSDHGGFLLKKELSAFLSDLGYSVLDVGTEKEEACDYPDFAYAVAKMVADGKAEKGIMIDAVGIASAIVANKVPGIRASCCHDAFSAHSSREHNDANVLTLGGRVLGSELAKSIVREWLVTPFAGGRHLKRITKIGEIESRLRSGQR